MKTFTHARVAIAAGVIWLGGSNLSFAAPAPSNGGGGAGGGGGHAVESGGGPSHAAEQAPAVQHSQAPAVHNEAPAVQHTEAPAAQRSQATIPQHITQPRAVEHQPVNGTPVVTRTQTNNAARLTNSDHIRNPYRERSDHRYQNEGVYTTYPWWPFSYGYNSGWYGNNDGNNEYPFWVPSDSSDDNGTTNSTDPSGTSATPQTPSNTPAPTQATGITPDAQAQINNAVEKSPAMVTANNSVQIAQSALDSERERVLAALRTKPDYQEALQRRHKAASELHAAKTTDGQDSNAVVAAANEKLDAGDDVTKMEEQAVATDPAAAAAKARLEQAIADRNALRAQLTAQSQAAVK